MYHNNFFFIIKVSLFVGPLTNIFYTHDDNPTTVINIVIGTKNILLTVLLVLIVYNIKLQ